jgi:hypothetical protein
VVLSDESEANLAAMGVIFLSKAKEKIRDLLPLRRSEPVRSTLRFIVPRLRPLDRVSAWI